LGNNIMSLKKELFKQLVTQTETAPDLKQRVATKDICGVEVTSPPTTAVLDTSLFNRNPLKTEKFVPQTQLQASSKALEFYDLDNFSGSNKDPLREEYGSEWTVKANKIRRKEGTNLIPKRKSVFFTEETKIGEINRVYTVNGSTSTFPEPTGYFYDLHFSVNVPVERTTLRNNASAKNIYESEVVYNYYNENFEKSYKSDRVNERILPNITVVTSELSQDYDRFADHVYLADKLSKSTSLFRFKDYIANYGSEVEGIVRDNPEKIREVERPFENVYIASSDYNGDYSESLRKRAVFPMASKLSLPTFMNYGELGKDIVNSGLDSRLMAHVGLFPSTVSTLEELPSDPNTLTKFSRFSRPFKVNIRTSTDIFGFSEPLEVRDENITVYSFDGWLENYLSEVVESSLDEKEKLSKRAFGNERQYLNSIFLGQTEQDVKDLEDKEYSALTALTGMFFSKNYRDILKKKSRSIQEIFSGKKAHSETLFYIIKKRDFLGNLIQTFFVNPYNNDLLELLDTQVKYGKQYFYQVIQARFVLGSRYSYKRVKNAIDRDLVVTVEPYPVVAEIDLFETSLTITDANPMPPDVEFRFYRNNPEKALVLLRPGQGSVTEFPVFIDPDDFIDGSTQVEFKKDDRPKEYVLYVTDEKPRDYEDFAGKSSRFQVGSAAVKAIPVSVEPNKDYWVTFRTKDIHDKLSNPTSVYQLRMIYENGVLLPTKKIYNFEGEMREPVEFFKNFKVTPSELQLEIDNSALVNKLAKDVTTKDIQLEAENNTRRIWNDDTNTRKFKIRVTSKNSGKSLDINYKMLLERKQQK